MRRECPFAALSKYAAEPSKGGSGIICPYLKRLKLVRVEITLENLTEFIHSRYVFEQGHPLEAPSKLKGLIIKHARNLSLENVPRPLAKKFLNILGQKVLMWDDRQLVLGGFWRYGGDIKKSYDRCE
ncbi:hypothetical protein FRC02_006419 [Tulasnella sp. 418]|nr:hypothetical protein FRC02_006419 [Tulasnella sp. 418]